MAGLKIFVSYTSADRDWAHWIAWTLKEAGHEPFVHEWEVGAGESIPAWMERRLGEADRLIGVFSEKYTEALFSKSERTAAYWDDPLGKRGFLTPVAIEAIPKWPRFVAPLKRLSLVDLDPDAARAALIGFLEPPGPPSLGRAMFFLRRAISPARSRFTRRRWRLDAGWRAPIRAMPSASATCRSA